MRDGAMADFGPMNEVLQRLQQQQQIQQQQQQQQLKESSEQSNDVIEQSAGTLKEVRRG
jgi:hypothetical protein